MYFGCNTIDITATDIFTKGYCFSGRDSLERAWKNVDGNITHNYLMKIVQKSDKFTKVS